MKIIKISGPKKKNFYSIKDIKKNETHIFATKITGKMHKDFTSFSGDKSPIHTNKLFCIKNGYNQKIGYAFLITNILSKIYGMYFPGGTELCLKQICNFKKPFFVNDKLKIILKVIQKNIFARLITVEVLIKNQKNKIIFEGEVIFQLILNETK